MGSIMEFPSSKSSAQADFRFVKSWSVKISRKHWEMNSSLGIDFKPAAHKNSFLIYGICPFILRFRQFWFPKMSCLHHLLLYVKSAESSQIGPSRDLLKLSKLFEKVIFESFDVCCDVIFTYLTSVTTVTKIMSGLD